MESCADSAQVIEQAELTVVEGNDRAKRMYEKYGFVEMNETLK